MLNAFAIYLNERAGDLLNMLQSKEYKLDINDEKQTIQGVYVSDKAMNFSIIHALIMQRKISKTLFMVSPNK